MNNTPQIKDMFRKRGWADVRRHKDGTWDVKHPKCYPKWTVRWEKSYLTDADIGDMLDEK